VADLKGAYDSKVTFTSDTDPEGGGRYFSLPNGTLNGYAGPKETDKVVSFLAGEDCGE
jgi:hypothetical protein